MNASIQNFSARRESKEKTMIPANVLNQRTPRPVDLTQIGFGGAPLGNLYRRIDEDVAQATWDAAWEIGIR